jgi:hypothetical protein
VNARCPAQPIASIDDVSFGDREELVATLRTAWDTVPWDDV